MSTPEIAYLALVLTAFATFIVGVGFISAWSRRPSRDGAATSPAHRQVSGSPSAAAEGGMPVNRAA